MGGSSSKTPSKACCGSCTSCSCTKATTCKKDWGLSALEEAVKDKFALQAMAQREIQMSIAISQARDSILIFGSAWTTLVTGITIAKLKAKPVPTVAFAPVVIGGVMLGNMIDFAYGTKMQRVVKEAEWIMANEKYRFVPPKQAPFHKHYNQELQNQANEFPVSALFPPGVPWSRWQ